MPPLVLAVLLVLGVAFFLEVLVLGVAFFFLVLVAGAGVSRGETVPSLNLGEMRTAHGRFVRDRPPRTAKRLWSIPERFVYMYKDAREGKRDERNEDEWNEDGWNELLLMSLQTTRSERSDMLDAHEW